MKYLRRSIVLSCLAARLLLAQNTPPAPAAPLTPPVPPAEAHQFDFWLGEWEVFDPKGAKIGLSRIDSVSDGFALLENWTALPIGTQTGKSLNTYNRAKKCWQQFWVGPGVLELAGGLESGSMVMTGKSVSPQGATVLQRITWTPNADGSVRQFWESSTDDGKTWQASFDGIYRHKSG